VNGIVAQLSRARLALLGSEQTGRTSTLEERLARGETAAVGEAYDRHHEQVRAFARRLVGDDAAAEDLVQEVFVTLPRVIKRFEGASSLRTFLTGVAVNHARHHVRAAARRRAAGERMMRETVAGRARDPEELVSDRELATLLSCALDALPIEQRVAFVLLEVEQLSAAEAARATGAPEATMRTRLFHAKRKLREQLTQEGAR